MQIQEKLKKWTVLSLLLLTFLCGILTGCEKKDTSVEDSKQQIETLEDLADKKIAVMTGSFYESKALEYLPDSWLEYYQTTPDCFLAVEEGKADALVVSSLYFKSALEEYPNLQLVDVLCDADLYYGMTKSEFGLQIQKDLSEYLKKEWENGGQQALLDSWKSGDHEITPVDFDSLTGNKGTIRCAVEPLDLPYACQVEGGYAGIEAENLFNFCKEYGYKIDFQTMDWASILTGVVTGKLDLCMYTYYSDERAEKILFSEPYEKSQVVAVTKNLSYGKLNGETSFIDSLKKGFNNTFIRESRWKLLSDGFKVTLEIVILSAIFGTLFGALLCWGRLGRYKSLSRIVAVFVRLIQGIPVVVLLLVLYYIVFSNTEINGIVVGIIGFSINFGVYVCEIMRSSINSVDKGQWEAAESLGMSQLKTMSKVILPQAVRFGLPVYKGEFISMVKITSVVGYIAVQDITKASDIIRSRTYEAFFPLIVTALIYFLVAWFLTALLNKIELNTEPSRRKHILAGINTKVEIPEYSRSSVPSFENDVVIELFHLKKSFEQSTPLKDINAKIMRGDIISIIGPSGSGKTTLLRSINRLETPSSGEVYVFGKTAPEKGRELSELRERMGMVFQSFNLFNHLSIIENVMLAPVTLKKMSRQEAYEKGIALLRKFGLGDKALQYPSMLSGGQKQRVAIVRTLIMEPDIMLLDEPTSALDPTMIGEVLRMISELTKSGMTMMIVTHELKFARNVSNRVFYMDQGIIYEEGSCEEIFDHPQKARTRAFINHIKMYNFEIKSKDFDYLRLLSELDYFGHDELLAKQKIYNIEHVVEELIMQGLVKNMKVEYPAKLYLDYEENETLYMRLRYGGENIDILSTMDQTAKDILSSIAQNINHSWTREEQNTISLEIS